MRKCSIRKYLPLLKLQKKHELPALTSSRSSSQSLRLTSRIFDNGGSSSETQGWVEKHTQNKESDAIHSKYLDDHGHEAEALASKHGLPLSPWMDPHLIAARERYRTPKSLPSKELSPFQQKLEKNVYAQALATPIRTCNLTGVRLPRLFLLAFGLKRHPETGAPWLLPEGLYKPETNRSNATKEKHTSPPSPASANNSDSTADPYGYPPKITAQLPPKASGTATHFLSQSPALLFITRLRLKDYLKVIPMRWKDLSGLQPKEVLWRQDTDTFVLDLLRKKVLGQLKYLSKRPAAYIVRCHEDNADINSHHQVGVIFWLGPLQPVEDVPEELESGNLQPNSHSSHIPNLDSGPQSYATILYKHQYLPLYNLPRLLGANNVLQLREHSSLFVGEMAVLKNKKITLDVQLWLWKLEGYVGQGGEG